MKRLPSSDACTPPELRRLLYLEGEDSNWDVTELRLRGKYHLVRARDAQEACRAVKRLGSSLYAILMDIQLAGSPLDGIQLTRLLRGGLTATALPQWAQDLPRVTVPIIFVTAYGHSPHSEAELIAAGGNRLVPKPVDFVALNMALAGANLQRAQQLLDR